MRSRRSADGSGGSCAGSEGAWHANPALPKKSAHAAKSDPEPNAPCMKTIERGTRVGSLGRSGQRRVVASSAQHEPCPKGHEMCDADRVSTEEIGTLRALMQLTTARP